MYEIRNEAFSKILLVGLSTPYILSTFFLSLAFVETPLELLLTGQMDRWTDKKEVYRKNKKIK